MTIAIRPTSVPTGSRKPSTKTTTPRSTRKPVEAPSESWSDQQLADYFAHHLSQADVFRRKSAVALWYAGRAMIVVHERTKATKSWSKWCKTHDINPSRAYEAMKVAETFDSEEDVKLHTLTEAKIIAGAIKEKKKPKPPVVPSEGEVVEVPEPQEPTIEAPKDIRTRVRDFGRAAEVLVGDLAKMPKGKLPVADIRKVIATLQGVLGDA